MGKYSNEIRIIEKFLLGYFFIVCIILLLSTAIPTTLNYDKVSSEDWNRHSIWIGRILKGDFTTIYEYPPFFHLIMALPVYFFKENIRYLQVVFAVLTSASILYFIYKKYGKLPMIIASFLLATNIVFLTFNSQLIPQVLDYILMPLIVLAYFKGKYFTTSLGLIFLIYNHLVGIFFFGIFFVYSLLWNRKYLKYLLLVVILSSPIFYIHYLPNFMDIARFFQGDTSGNMFIVGRNITTNFSATGQMFQGEWDKQFTQPLVNFFAFNGFIMWAILPFIIYLLIKEKQIDDWQRFYLVWCICLMPMILFNVLRWSSYFLMPLMLFEVSVIAKALNNDKR